MAAKTFDEVYLVNYSSYDDVIYMRSDVKNVTHLTDMVQLSANYIFCIMS